MDKIIEKIFESKIIGIIAAILFVCLLIFFPYIINVIDMKKIEKIYYYFLIIINIILFIRIIIYIVKILYYKNKKGYLDINPVNLIPYNMPNDMTPSEAGYLINKNITLEQIKSLIPYEIGKGIFSIIKENDKTYLQKNSEFSFDEELIVKKVFYNTFDESDKIELKKIRIDVQSGYRVLIDCYKKTGLSYGQLICYYLVMLFSVCPLIYYLSMNYFNLSNYISLNIEQQKIIIALGLIGVALMLIIRFLVPTLNDYKNERIKLVRGYKKFLETVEKEKIQLLRHADSAAFYTVFSYAYALGITNVWLDNLEEYGLEDIKYITNDWSYKI